MKDTQTSFRMQTFLLSVHQAALGVSIRLIIGRKVRFYFYQAD